MCSITATISFTSGGHRYFTNPFEASNTAHEVAKFVTSEWLGQSITKLVNKILSRRITADECEEGGPYTGIGGIGYALLRVARIQPNEFKACLENCNRLIEYQLPHAKNASMARYSRYLTGTLGLEIIKGIADHMAGKLSATSHLAQIYDRLLPLVLENGYQKIGDDEILNGRAGFLAGVLEFKLWTGHSILNDQQISSVLQAIISSGREYSRRHHSSARLMYQWHEKEYLGAAHGISGIYQILLSYWNMLDDQTIADLLQSINWFCSLQSPDGNFPSSSGYIGYSKGEDELVHWCHGAVGALQLLVCAYEVINKDEKYLQAAVKCAELIWTKGVLKKGPGICHGLAGSGYAFLILYRLTRREEWLDRAKAFAYLLINAGFERAARTPDSPFSLFEGWAGALCFMTDLVQPEKAQFPLVPIPFNN